MQKRAFGDVFANAATTTRAMVESWVCVSQLTACAIFIGRETRANDRRLAGAGQADIVAH